MNKKEREQILAALEEQGWTWENTANGHYKLWSPNTTHPMITAAMSSGDVNIKSIVLRDLRKAGFIWPWPQKVAKEKKGRSRGLHFHTSLLCIPSLTELEVVPMAQPALVPNDAAPIQTDPDIDTLFRQLKEARTYASLAREAREEALTMRDSAERALQGSEKELSIALTQLKSIKEAFDKAFGGE